MTHRRVARPSLYIPTAHGTHHHIGARAFAQVWGEYNGTGPERRQRRRAGG